MLLYKTGVTPGVLESKSVRSRFVEELLWGLEQEAGRLIQASDQPPLLATSFRLGPIPCGVPAMAKDAAVRLDPVLGEALPVRPLDRAGSLRGAAKHEAQRG